MAACEPQPLDYLPAEHRELLARWIKRGGNSRWETLLKDAGTTNLQLADALLDWLLRNGWAVVTEQHRLSEWWPQQIKLLHLPQLRTLFGLRDKDDDALRWQTERVPLQALLNTPLAPAVAALDGLPPHRALVRGGLILRLNDWQEQLRQGTYRDFALFARGDTKSISDTEWDWLNSLLDLAEFGIERHIPLLLIAAPLSLHLPNGKIDLEASPDFSALTPSTLKSVVAVSSEVQRWVLVENRTSFERLAKRREDHEAVVWLPGFPPGWWKEAMGRLLDLVPAPALLSCDPDPAGIAILLNAAELWRERQLNWQPHKMSAGDLAMLRMRKPLSQEDYKQLDSLKNNPTLPSILSELMNWMLQRGEKGEQEGYL